MGVLARAGHHRAGPQLRSRMGLGGPGDGRVDDSVRLPAQRSATRHGFGARAGHAARRLQRDGRAVHVRGRGRTRSPGTSRRAAAGSGADRGGGGVVARPRWASTRGRGILGAFSDAAALWTRLPSVDPAAVGGRCRAWRSVRFECCRPRCARLAPGRSGEVPRRSSGDGRAGSGLWIRVFRVGSAGGAEDCPRCSVCPAPGCGHGRQLWRPCAIAPLQCPQTGLA
jgi:hypothetical protein